MSAIIIVCTFGQSAGTGEPLGAYARLYRCLPLQSHLRDVDADTEISKNTYTAHALSALLEVLKNDGISRPRRLATLEIYVVPRYNGYLQPGRATQFLSSPSFNSFFFDMDNCKAYCHGWSVTATPVDPKTANLSAQIRDIATYEYFVYTQDPPRFIQYPSMIKSKDDAIVPYVPHFFHGSIYLLGSNSREIYEFSEKTNSDNDTPIGGLVTSSLRMTNTFPPFSMEFVKACLHGYPHE